jgi:hypothetical protein
MKYEATFHFEVKDEHVELTDLITDRRSTSTALR